MGCMHATTTHTTNCKSNGSHHGTEKTGPADSPEGCTDLGKWRRTPGNNQTKTMLPPTGGIIATLLIYLSPPPPRQRRKRNEPNRQQSEKTTGKHHKKEGTKRTRETSSNSSNNKGREEMFFSTPFNLGPRRGRPRSRDLCVHTQGHT